jgi:phage baseplate assembly protein W
MATTKIYGKLPFVGIKKEISEVGWNNVRGLNYPIGKANNKVLERGFFSTNTNIKLIRNNLTQLLSTEKGERIMLPGFGANLKRFLFAPLDEQTFELIKEEVLSAISKYAKQVKVLKLGVFPLDGGGMVGLNAIKISLFVKLIEFENLTFEVDVKIG